MDIMEILRKRIDKDNEVYIRRRQIQSERYHALKALGLTTSESRVGSQFSEAKYDALLLELNSDFSSVGG
jgi:hypothetical protein